MQRSDSGGAMACGRASRALRVVLLAFFALAATSLVLIYLLAPALFVETLFETPTPAGNLRSAPLTLFLLLVLGLIGLGALGVVRRWRWVWWLLLLAFTASALEIPAITLELAGVLPLTVPAWYAVLRMLVSAGLVVIAVWMWRVQRACGEWGMVGGRPAKTPHER